MESGYSYMRISVGYAGVVVCSVVCIPPWVWGVGKWNKPPVGEVGIVKPARRRRGGFRSRPFRGSPRAGTHGVCVWASGQAAFCFLFFGCLAIVLVSMV